MSLKFRSSVPKELKLHVREIQLSKNRIRLMEYLKTKCNHNEVFSYKKHTPVLKIKMHVLMIIITRYSFLTRRITHAVF